MNFDSDFPIHSVQKKKKEVKFKNVQFITIYVVEFDEIFPNCQSRHQILKKMQKIAIPQAFFR